MKAMGQQRIVFVTGNDTGVGKTVLAAALTRRLRAHGVDAVALKPLCSGGRNDARALQTAADHALTLDEVNPWHFRAALAPKLAARLEKRRISRREVAAHVRMIARRFQITLVEGAGGLLSPLTEDGDNQDLLAALRPEAVIIVVPNRLGAVNQARLVLAALPKIVRRCSVIVLVEQRKPDAASRTNAASLAEFAAGISMVHLPWLASGRLTFRAAAALDALAAFTMADS